MHKSKLIYILCIITFGFTESLFAQSRSVLPISKSLYDATGRYIGPVVSSNQVELVGGANSSIAAVPFSYSGFWRPSNTAGFGEDSLIIFFPKRDCRGDAFIKMDGVTVPYASYPQGLVNSGFGKEYFSRIEYLAPIQSTFGYKYLFSKKNLATNQCVEGTYFGYYMQAEKIEVNFRPPFSLK